MKTVNDVQNPSIREEMISGRSASLVTLSGDDPSRIETRPAVVGLISRVTSATESSSQLHPSREWPSRSIFSASDTVSACGSL